MLSIYCWKPFQSFEFHLTAPPLHVNRNLFFNPRSSTRKGQSNAEFDGIYFYDVTGRICLIKNHPIHVSARTFCGYAYWLMLHRYSHTRNNMPTILLVLMSRLNPTPKPVLRRPENNRGAFVNKLMLKLL